MNPTAVRLISALIPSRKARHAFRDRHAAPKTKPAGDSFAAMDKRLKAIEAQLNLLVHFAEGNYRLRHSQNSFALENPATTTLFVFLCQFRFFLTDFFL